VKDIRADNQPGNLPDEQPTEVRVIVGISRHDDPDDVDAAYGPGTYARLFGDREEA
jgi:hypothetical protein